MDWLREEGDSRNEIVWDPLVGAFRGFARRLTADLRFGVTWGLYFALAYVVIAIVVVLANGGRTLRDTGISFIGLAAGYFAGGILSGAVFGVGRRYARTTIGAMTVGFFVALPSAFVMSSLVLSREEWRLLPRAALILSAIVGPLAALALRARTP
ncbi:MAG: hypothetical protein ACM3ML_29220 [Micromonosporaceae bacterium]